MLSAACKILQETLYFFNMFKKKVSFSTHTFHKNRQWNVIAQYLKDEEKLYRHYVKSERNLKGSVNNLLLSGRPDLS